VEKEKLWNAALNEAEPFIHAAATLTANSPYGQNQLAKNVLNAEVSWSMEKVTRLFVQTKSAITNKKVTKKITKNKVTEKFCSLSLPPVKRILI